MILEVFLMALAVLALFLFLNFKAEKNTTQAAYGILGGLWAIVIGMAILATGFEMPITEMHEFDKIKDTTTSIETINGTENVTQLYEDQHDGAFDYSLIFGIFFIGTGMYAFLGNVMRLVP